MKRLYFIRHGLSENNKAGRWSGQLDVALLPKGRRQAEQAGVQARQKGLKFDLIVSSPLQRAYDTACLVAREFDYPTNRIVRDNLFQECGFGVLQGTEYGDLLTKYFRDETVVDDYRDVETTAQLFARASQAWSYLQTLPQDSVLLVSHTAFGRALRRVILGKPLDAIVESFKNAEIEQIY